MDQDLVQVAKTDIKPNTTLDQVKLRLVFKFNLILSLANHKIMKYVKIEN